MSSAFKTLKTSDVTVTPYVTNKSYTIELTTANAEVYGITYHLFDGVTSIGTGPFYDSNALYYRSIRQLYYSHYLPSLAPTIPLSEQDYSQLEEDQYGNRKTNNTLIYDNYLQSTAASGSSEVDDRFNFEHYANQGSECSVLSIPQILYGESITPGSFRADYQNGYIELIDDGNGNIVNITAGNIKVGNIIYSHGLIILWYEDYIGVLDPALDDTVITFKSTFTIYENQTRCHVNENEFNFTQNPSSTLNSDVAVDATAQITVVSYGVVGDTISVHVQDPVYGYIYLGGYTVTVLDTSTAILATNTTAALNTNIYGYTASVNSSTITLTARTGLGSSINEGSRLIVDYTPNAVETFDYTFDNTFQ